MSFVDQIRPTVSVAIGSGNSDVTSSCTRRERLIPSIDVISAIATTGG